MKKIFALPLLLPPLLFSLELGDTFESNFTQTITDDKKKVITYKGDVIASKPQNALWSYKTPIIKDVYINQNTITIVEPEIEQAIIKKMSSDINLFELAQNAKKISDTLYEAYYMQKSYTIEFQNGLIQSIRYQDEFDNQVAIIFTQQQKDNFIDNDLFVPKIPSDFDIISQ